MFRNIVLSYKVIFQNTKGLAIIYIFICLLSATFYPLQMLSLEKLINVVGKYVSQKGSITGILFWTVLLTFSFLISGIYDFMRPVLSMLMYKKTVLGINIGIYSTLKKMRYECFESADNADVLYRMAGEPYKILQNMFSASINMLYFVISSCGIVFVFTSYNVILGVVVLIVSTVLCYVQYRSEYQQTEQENSQTSQERKMDRFQNLFFEKASLYEIHVFEAFDNILNKWKKISVSVIKEKRKYFRKYIKTRSLTEGVTVIFSFMIMCSIVLVFLNKSISYGQLCAGITNVQKYIALVGTSAGLIANLVQKSNNMMFYSRFLQLEYSDAAEPPVRCGVSH